MILLALRAAGKVHDKVSNKDFSDRWSLVFEVLIFLFFYPLHTLSRAAGAQPAVYEWVKVAIHDRLDVARFDASTEVFYHAIRLEDIAANLVAPGDTAFFAIKTFH